MRLFLLIIIIGTIGINILDASDSSGYGSYYTHPAITRLAVDNTVKNGYVDRYLKEELKITDGLDNIFRFNKDIPGSIPEEEIERNNNTAGKTLRRGYPTVFGKPYSGRYLIISGSEAEDHPTERAQHHFLDPISGKGLDNNYYGVGVLADFLALFYPPAEQGNAGRLVCSLMSLCEPAFNLDGTPAIDRLEGKTSAAYPYNYFAWPDTRRYFYKALTAGTEEERGHYFALTFFSLGHNLHLLEDMGVPAHTRNDFLYDHIWHGLIKGSYLEGYLESGRTVERFRGSPGILSFKRLSDFWDNNGSHESPGLAEYINNNFFSEGTIFRGYDFPVDTGIKTYEITAEDGKKDFVQYYSGSASDGQDIPHLAAVGLLHQLFDFMGYKDRAKYTAYLDPYCYQDYSEIIIPGVVSYVSGVMEYFFRGRIAVIKDVRGGLKIKNISAEPITDGAFEIYYDSDKGLRTRLATYQITPDTWLEPGDITEGIEINLPVDNVAPGRYIIVFKGRLGNEDNTVIGKVVSTRLFFVSDRSGASEIYSMNMDGNGLETVISNREPSIDYTHPVVSPDGTMMAFHSNRDGRDAIWLMYIPTGDIRRIADGYWPDWSPDGRRIVFCKDTGGKSDIFIIDVDANEEIRLTDDSYHNLWPAWSPDGFMVAYTSMRENKGDIILIDLSNNSTQNITASLDNLDRWRPAWSPDGRKIAYEKPSKIVYSVTEFFYVNVYTLDLDSGIEANLTNIDDGNKEFGVWNGTPRWLNDNEIVIESNVAEELWTDIWIIDSDGRGFIKQFVATPGHDGYPFVW